MKYLAECICEIELQNYGKITKHQPITIRTQSIYEVLELF